MKLTKADVYEIKLDREVNKDRLEEMRSFYAQKVVDAFNEDIVEEDKKLCVDDFKGDEVVLLSRLREVVSELKSKHKVTNSDADDDYLFGYNEGKKDLFKTFDELFGEVME